MLNLPAMVSWTQQCCMGRCMPYRHIRTTVIAMAKPWRPDMNDVDRLSRGDGAKRRGTGNFNIPHRLNSDERPVYESAKKKGYLQVRGTGYRKGRKGNPLPNVYRQWCDAKATACIVIEQDMTGSSRDVVVVDLAPLRQSDLQPAVHLCSKLAEDAGARHIPVSERPLDAVPFNTIPVDLPTTVQQMLYPGEAGPAEPGLAPPSPEQLQAAEMAVLQQADLVRELKASRLSNSDPVVQQHVQDLLVLKSKLQQLLDAAAQQAPDTHSSSTNGSTAETAQHHNSLQHHGLSSAASGAYANHDAACSSSSEGRAASTDISGCTADSSDYHDLRGSTGSSMRKSQVLPEDHPFVTCAVWQLPVMPLFYEADRPAAKTLAKQISTALADIAAVRR